MREVYINDQRVDVNQDEAVDFNYETPMFSDISKIKSNTTSTYKLPMTERNLAIFKHVELYDVTNSLGYEELVFEEYRNGLPIIQNGRCVLVGLSDKIELAVVWGIKVALTEKLGKKLNELAKENPLYDQYQDCCPVKNDFMKAEDKSEIGFLHAIYGTGISSDNFTWKVPSVTVSRVLAIIAKACGVGIKFHDKNVESILKTKWIPFASMKTNDDDGIDNVGKKIINFETEQLSHNGQHFDFVMKPIDYEFSDSSKLIEQRSDFDGKYFTYFLIPDQSSWIDLSLSVAFHGDWSARKVRLKRLSYHNSPEDSDHSAVIGDYFAVYDSEKNRSYLNVRMIDQFKDLGTDYYADTKRRRYDYRLYEVMQNGTESKMEFRQHQEGNGFSVSLTGRLTVASPTGMNELVYPVALNLPDMTCTDFIKSICQMYALFPYFNIEENTLEFLQFDNIYDNKECAKDWDNKVLAESNGLTRAFGDYAKKNRFRYQDDETVSTTAEGYMYLNNNKLLSEKDLVDLKFAATDERMKEIKTESQTEPGVFVYDYKPMAYLPYFEKDDSGKVSFKSLKPRILSEKEINLNNGEKWFDYKALRFDPSLMFGASGGLLDMYYGRYKEVVEQPVLRDVWVMLTDVEQMQISRLDIIYLGGKYWMPMKIQVGITGKAKVSLMMLPKVFG